MLLRSTCGWRFDLSTAELMLQSAPVKQVDVVVYWSSLNSSDQSRVERVAQICAVVGANCVLTDFNVTPEKRTAALAGAKLPLIVVNDKQLESFDYFQSMFDDGELAIERPCGVVNRLRAAVHAVATAEARAAATAPEGQTDDLSAPMSPKTVRHPSAA